jgi:RNA ligase
MMNLEKLHKYREDGLLYSQVHPSLPLTIWNYSEKVQYEGLWDEVTLMCRGLVTDDQGNIVARPFRKFFNMEEKRHTPTQEFEVYEKMDGSLGILFNYNGEWILATRGSFASDQAIRGMEILQKYKYKCLHTDTTYLFEIIYPENRIVCKYEYEDLVMLGSIHTTSGTKCCIYSEGYEDLGFPLVYRYDGVKDYRQLKDMVSVNAEGFIVEFSNGDRMKIKGEEYLRLHRVMTNVSTTAVWEILSSGGDMTEILKDVPDEFFDKVDEVVKDLCIRFENIQRDYMSYFMDITNRVASTDRRGFAEEAKRYLHPALLFRLADGKDITSTIWKIIKPKFKKL